MTAVIDASALVEHLMQYELHEQVAVKLQAHLGSIHVPQLIFPETVAAIKECERGHKASPQDCARGIRRLLDLPARQWDVKPLTPRAWQLHHALSVYDAYYVALAERLHAHLITKDARLAQAVEAAHLCPVDLVQ